MPQFPKWYREKGQAGNHALIPRNSNGERTLMRAFIKGVWRLVAGSTIISAGLTYAALSEVASEVASLGQDGQHRAKADPERHRDLPED
jgi:hypothetical protein